MKSAVLLVFLPLAPLFTLAGETLVFEDRFDAKPAAGWRWLREDVPDWRVWQPNPAYRTELNLSLAMLRPKTEPILALKKAVHRSQGRQEP